MKNDGHSAQPNSMLRRFLSHEAAGGYVLMAVAAIALIVANSPLAPAYFAVFKLYLGPLSVLHWINDGLMAVFFLLVGLEIKREFVDGQLSSWPDRILPGVAAAGGMIVPALFYLVFAGTSATVLRGWAIPAATDIAFSLGVLALVGSRAPVSLKIFLTALAIIDDLGAIIVIAVFYTANLSLMALAAAAAVMVFLVGLNRFGVRTLWPYLLAGCVLWFFVHESGVHATLAGVLLALTIPIDKSPAAPDDEDSPLHLLEHAISPWVAFAIVPIFGFANAGVSLLGVNMSQLMHPVTLGIAAGLFLGKQVGVFGSVWLLVKAGLAQRPRDANWGQVYGVALLCGIGFTMSLFIGLLAFPSNAELEQAVKIGVLLGSILSAIAGALVLMASSTQKPQA
jgi:NhaA family Na+:H+ antiporter